MAQYSDIYLPGPDGVSPIQRTMQAARTERDIAREEARVALEEAFSDVPKPFAAESVVVATIVHKQIGEWKIMMVNIAGTLRPVMFREGTLGAELIRQLT